MRIASPLDTHQRWGTGAMRLCQEHVLPSSLPFSPCPSLIFALAFALVFLDSKRVSFVHVPIVIVRIIPVLIVVPDGSMSFPLMLLWLELLLLSMMAGHFFQPSKEFPQFWHRKTHLDRARQKRYLLASVTSCFSRPPYRHWIAPYSLKISGLLFKVLDHNAE